MRVVVDASVAIKWLLPEEGSATARQLLTEGHELIAPAWLQIEILSIVLRAVRQKRLSHDAGTEVIETFNSMPVSFGEDAPLRRQAWDVAVIHGGSLYDALYITLALKTDADLISADAGMIRVARAAGVRCGMLADGLPPPA